MSVVDVIVPVSGQTKSPVSVPDDREQEKNGLTGQPVSIPAETTNTIIQYLLAQGLSREDIVMPGGGKASILYLSEDFNTPLDGFEDYT